LEIVQRIAHQVKLTRSVVNDKNRSFGAVVIRGGDVHKDLAFFTHRLLFRFERGIVAAKNFAVREPQAELERLSLGIPAIGQIGINLVIGSNSDLAIAFRAGIFFGRFYIRGACGTGEQNSESDCYEQPG
jgi:hypothetical protein